VNAVAIKVLVANESRVFCREVEKILTEEHFELFTCHDGKDALAAIEEIRPDVALLDVALPSMYGFQVCEAVRKNPALSSKLILVASIYEKTRYKRAPISLYGADDYLEKHHIPDTLVGMIYRLVSGQKRVEAEIPQVDDDETVMEPFFGDEIVAREETREVLKRSEESETSVAPFSQSVKLPESNDNARRLARNIVSDILLYNQEKVDKSVHTGMFYEIFANEIAEGKGLYEMRIPEEIRRDTSYLDEAFAEMVDRRKAELEGQL
jgi:DNA-binding response OmpR family regulator